MKLNHKFGSECQGSCILQKGVIKLFFFFQDSKITLDEYRAQPDNPAAIELGNMFEFYKRGNPDRDIRLTKKLNEETQRFDVWVRENKAMLEEAFSKKQ